MLKRVGSVRLSNQLIDLLLILKKWMMKNKCMDKFFKFNFIVFTSYSLRNVLFD